MLGDLIRLTPRIGDDYTQIFQTDSYKQLLQAKTTLVSVSRKEWSSSARILLENVNQDERIRNIWSKEIYKGFMMDLLIQLTMYYMQAS
jgi:hypothetical protein